jgi:hypothetical protein
VDLLLVVRDPRGGASRDWDSLRSSPRCADMVMDLSGAITTWLIEPSDHARALSVGKTGSSSTFKISWSLSATSTRRPAAEVAVVSVGPSPRLDTAVPRDASPVGGKDHYAAYLANTCGFEVELVAHQT